MKAKKNPPTQKPGPAPKGTGSNAAPRPKTGPREIDLTWWLFVGGLTVFVVLLAGAFTVYTLTQVQALEAAATAAVGLAVTPTTAPTEVPTEAPPTVTPTPLGVLVLADTPTRRPSPTITLSPTASPTIDRSATPVITGTPTRRPPTPSPTKIVTPTPFVYTVRAGDTLGAIAQVYGLTIEELLTANPDLENPDSLLVGQTLIIPFPALLPPAEAGTTLAGTPAVGLGGTSSPETRSVLEGDLASAYPLSLAGPRVTIYYQPGSFTENAGPDVILTNAEETLTLVEQTLNVTYPGRVDVYLAGTLFASPNQAIRQRSFPAQRRLFVLYDGSGDAADRRYLLAHELTKVTAWNTYGVPGSVMLSEGLAVYVGQTYLAEGGHVGLEDFCRALARTNRLPALGVIENSVQGFLDPVRSLYNYQTAACFVSYLIRLKGIEAFGHLYSTSNYPANYGAGFKSLAEAFSLEMNSGAFQIGFDPDRLVVYYDEVATGYDDLFDSASPEQTAYETLDDARIAVLTLNFGGARALLDQFHILTR